MADSSLDDDLLNVVGFKSSGNANLKHPLSDSSSDEDIPKDSSKAKATVTQTKSLLPSKNDVSTVRSAEEDQGDESGSELSYGSDLYRDDEDKRNLGSMQEREREEILLQRGERRDDHIQRKKLKGKIQGNKKRGGILSRRDRHGGHLSSERETRGSRLRQQRGLDKVSRPQRGRAAHDSDESSGSESEYEDSEGEEDEDEDVHAANVKLGREKEAHERSNLKPDSDTKGPGKEAKHAEPDSLKKIILPRVKLAEWCLEPFFEDAVVGSLVRVSAGVDYTGQPLYRIYVICAVISDSPSDKYEFEGKRINKRLDLKWGSVTEAIKMDLVSNKEPTEAEFEQLFKAMESAGVPRLTMAAVEKKVGDFTRAKNYQYTPEVVKKMLEEKRAAMGGRLGRGFNWVVEKDRLQQQLELALQNGEQEQASTISSQLAAMEKLSSTQQEDERSKQERMLMEMNRKNKYDNFRNASKCAATKAADEAETANDPFSRRWTQSQNYYRTPKSAVASAQGEEEQEAARQQEKKRQQEEAQKKAKEARGSRAPQRALAAAVDAPRLLAARHGFPLELSLGTLDKWGSYEDAFIVRKRVQEGKYEGQGRDREDCRMGGTTLTVNDYKRRRGLL